jgi:hypothetical protein
MLVYNATNRELSYSTEQATRLSASGIVPLPNGSTGDELMVYLFFQSAGNPTLVSSSQHGRHSGKDFKGDQGCLWR